MPGGLDYAGAQIIGQRRAQQDVFAFHAHEDGDTLICLLADGMGGHAAGEVAARLATDTFLKGVKAAENRPVPDLRSLLDHANRALKRNLNDHPERAGMGCTFVALEMTGRAYRWISIGDSPLFLVRGDQVERINANHSMARHLDAAAERGEISLEEAAGSSSRNVLTAALTGETLTVFDHVKEMRAVEKGDVLIVASDGLETLAPDEIGSVLKANRDGGAARIVSALIKAVEARKKGNQDNTTLCVIAADGCR